MRKIIYSILILSLAGVALYFLVGNNKNIVSNVSENNSLPSFVWRYEKADSLNLDGQPKTNIFLDVVYPNKVTQKKLIATVDGGCNDLSDSNEDHVANSTVAQCYYAGLGYHFKITQGAKSYLVLRKTFEEALPSSNPPIYKYETVAEFPLN